jgi:hypothetical protein
MLHNVYCFSGSNPFFSALILLPHVDSLLVSLWLDVSVLTDYLRYNDMLPSHFPGATKRLLILSEKKCYRYAADRHLIWVKAIQNLSYRKRRGKGLIQGNRLLTLFETPSPLLN